MRATWMAGDFGVVARTISGGGEEFIARLRIAPGSHVLDIACGTGNTALPLARAGAIVTGVDIATNLLEQARERAAAEGLTITFAPRPALVASECARVLKPGGLLAMANWNPASFTGRMFKVGSNHVPAPPGIAPSVLWGDDATVRKRLAPFFTNIETQLIPIDFDMAVSPAGAVDFFRKYFGPTQMAFARLDEAGQAALAADLTALWSSANVSPNPESHTLVKNEYLQITATRS
jgi:SAM-dependent methyltransferase